MVKILSKCLLKACDPQQAIERWVESFPGSPAVAVIPNANMAYFYTR